MKNLLLIFFAILFITACAGNQVSQVCPAPEGQASWICEKSAEAKVTPEQVYGWIFSASAIAAISDVAEIQEICDFKKEVAQWYVDVYPVTYDSVISKVIEEMKLIKDGKIRGIPAKDLLDEFNLVRDHFD